MLVLKTTVIEKVPNRKADDSHQLFIKDLTPRNNRAVSQKRRKNSKTYPSAVEDIFSEVC
jgi:hypothetical protein